MSKGMFPGQDNEYPRNKDRARWAASAVARFAKVSSVDEDLWADPGTVLGDLLADLMHWCDAHRAGHHLYEAIDFESIDFESALARAFINYQEEVANEGTGTLEDYKTPLG